jgi:hypothetical protein
MIVVDDPNAQSRAEGRNELSVDYRTGTRLTQTKLRKRARICTKLTSCWVAGDGMSACRATPHLYDLMRLCGALCRSEYNLGQDKFRF